MLYKKCSELVMYVVVLFQINGIVRIEKDLLRLKINSSTNKEIL